jgi:hypothetical protein
VLLLVLNWFYHRVYWNEHLAELHGKKKKILGIGVGLAAAQMIGLAMLGFSSVYREGFETVLFLQAIVLEARRWHGARRRRHRPGGDARGRAPDDPAPAQASAQEDAGRDRAPDPLGAGRHGRDDGPDAAGRRLGARHSGRGAAAPVLGRALAGDLPDLRGAPRAGAAIVFVLGSYVLAETLRKRKRRAILDKPAPVTPS